MFNRLFSKLRKPDKEAKRIIFEMFCEKIYQTAYYITNDPYLAQDVLQETFIKAFRSLDSLKNGEHFEAWIRTIAKRTAIDVMRKQNRWNGIPTEDVFLEKVEISQNGSTVEQEVEQNEMMEIIQHHMEKLKPDYYEVLFLKYKKELKDHEIAEKLHVSVGTIKSRLHRAKKLLKKALESEMKTEGGERADVSK